MQLAFALHMYQPSFQKPSVLRDAVQVCYHPLLKLVRSKPHFRFTLNIPLATLALLKEHKYYELINSIKELVDAERIELTGTGAFHPLFPKLTQKNIEAQILYNECGISHFFGRNKDFEGDAAFVLKDVLGFFPPELAVDSSLLSVLSEFGYEWMLCDSGSLSGKPNCLASIPGYSTPVISRDRDISNIFAFKRDSNTDDIFYAVSNKTDKFVVIALDAETFGMHNPEGIILLENFIDLCQQKGYDFMTISNVASSFASMKLEELIPGSWAGDSNFALWDSKDNKMQQALWELFDHVQNLSFDDNADLNPLPLEMHPDYNLHLLESMNSDQFWWLSGQKIGNTYAYDLDFVTSALSIYSKIFEYNNDPSGTRLLKNVIDLLR